ncbi:MAG TPA: fluoride efflux transporter CrcB [Humibacillus xanthopallidus]|nr:fluoride efflux transporter CrcB [Humibacillus xanthopallidus]
MPTDPQPMGAGAGPAGAATPVDPDAPSQVPLRRHASSLVRERWDIVAVIAAGGALGSAARYGAGVLWPHDASEIAWSTFVVNVVGGFLLGLLMVFVNDVWPPNRYVRPFLGVGVLGGFTTFSTYMLDTHALLDAGRPPVALLYLLGTLVVGLVAVWLGILVGRGAAAVSRTRRARRAHREGAS